MLGGQRLLMLLMLCRDPFVGGPMLLQLCRDPYVEVRVN